MLLLSFGLLLFCVSHLSIAVVPTLAERRKEGPIKGAVALLNLTGMALIVFGWRSAEVQWLYALPPVVTHLALTLIVVAVYLIVSASRPSRLKRVLRHPQLTGVFLWAVAHLLLNGDTRSLLLFGTLATWTLVEMLVINRRDGVWVRPEAPPLSTDLATAAVALVVLAVLIWAHPWFTGMPVTLPG